MRWEATDQFGNLYVALCDATSLDELKPHLASMVAELIARSARPIRITIDTEFGEINGPDPEQVSHVLQIPWISGLADRELLREEIAGLVVSPDIQVELAP